jgi:hypothetical protein
MEETEEKECLEGSGSILDGCLVVAMGGLVISRFDCRANSARRRTLANFTVVSTVICSGYVVNKTVSRVLMNVILGTMI